MSIKLMTCAAVMTVAAVAGIAGDAKNKVYSPEQAKLGLAAYDRACASCHDGGTMGPELWGEAFLDGWKNQEVASLFTRIQETMPADNPGSLSEEDTLGVIAYILQQNGYPAGDKAIASPAALKGVVFTTPE